MGDGHSGSCHVEIHSRMDTRPWECESLDFSQKETNKQEERKELPILVPKGMF